MSRSLGEALGDDLRIEPLPLPLPLQGELLWKGRKVNWRGERNPAVASATEEEELEEGEDENQELPDGDDMKG
jgi:hypothetical protein